MVKGVAEEGLGHLDLFSNVAEKKIFCMSNVVVKNKHTSALRSCTVVFWSRIYVST